MKAFKLVFVSLLALTFVGCQEEEPILEIIVVPSNLSVSTEVSTDGSGIVVFTATADDVLTYTFKFSDGDVQVSPNGTVTKRFTLVGLNTYDYSVVASGTGGVSSSASFQVSVESDFSDFEAMELLTGGDLNEDGEVVTAASKTWYLAAVEPGHLGVGATLAFLPDQFWFPAFFSASPFEKCGEEISACFCDDELTFSLNATGNQLTYEQDNKGATFFNVGHQDVVGGDAGEDACFDFDTSGVSSVSLAPTTVDWSQVPDPAFNSRGTVMNFTNDGFMGYYISTSTYEILEITSTTMHVRAIDGNDSNLAWYLKFSTTPVDEQGDNGGGSGTTFENLIWSQEFDTDGVPDPAVWNYDLGTGDNGWGNGESQYYTDRSENIIVEDGVLKITAQAESFSGSNYTSSRIQTYEKFEFQYGRVDARAKLPTGGGTWPAIWMLGADFETNIWPAAGEIDIMEHVGNNQDHILGSTHDPLNFAGDARSVETTVTGASDDFHVYSVIWTETDITFLVDDVEFGTLSNDANRPFDKDFFLIMNVAMGGTFGGTIDPGFTSSTMEVDYIRVYQ